MNEYKISLLFQYTDGNEKDKKIIKKIVVYQALISIRAGDALNAGVPGLPERKKRIIL